LKGLNSELKTENVKRMTECSQEGIKLSHCLT